MLYTSPDLNGVSKRLQSVQPIRAAATIVLVRSALVGFEIFMVRRTTRAVFGGGMYVFPGGRVDADDQLQRRRSVHGHFTESMATVEGPC